MCVLITAIPMMAMGRRLPGAEKARAKDINHADDQMSTAFVLLENSNNWRALPKSIWVSWNKLFTNNNLL
jgi:hypothetical protein